MNPVKTLTDLLYDKKKKLSFLHSLNDADREKYNYYHYPKGKKYYVIGSPSHTNLGDSAIALAQVKFIENCGISRERIKELTLLDFFTDRRILLHAITEGDVLCGIGGGNMGNFWPDEENLRIQMIKSFPHNKIIIFPQSIFFTDDEAGRESAEESVRFYNSKRITVCARDEVSYKTALSLYPIANVILAPDIVLSTDMSFYGVEKSKTEGVLLCFRSDKEKKISDDTTEMIKNYLTEINLDYTQTDMHSQEEVTKANRRSLVCGKVREISRCRLLITDRLHGMILAALTETPCIVYGNNHHKISAFYKWFENLGYIVPADEKTDVKKEIERLINMDDCHFSIDIFSDNFKDLASILME